VDFAAVPGLYEAIRARAETAAVPVAGVIGKTYKGHLVDVTLVESGSHPPVTQTPAAPGAPPAVMPGGVHGSLRGSVTMGGPVGGGGIGESWVNPNVIYAATQEYGGVHHAVRGPYMWLWINYIGPAAVKRRGWRKETVTIPERPYMRRAVAETIANGSLSRAAAAAFAAMVLPGE
jgi:hypothetical protein